MSQLTIKSLAGKLGLSTSTVSKALKDSHEISADTKKKVQEMARELGYVPNPYASSLRGRKSKTIAVVLPEVANSFFSLSIKGIEAVAQEKGYHVLISLTNESYEKEREILKAFLSGRVDGILISISQETVQGDHITEMIEHGIPVVFFDRVLPDLQAARITTNDYESSYQATQHLVNCGCRQINFLAIPESLAISQERMAGYKQALSDNNIPFKASDIVSCNNDNDKDYDIVHQLLQREQRPDGILASVEKLTTAIYEAARSLQLSIPGQLKVICFSNLPTAPILNPSLTTVTQPAFEMGQAAATLLLKRLEKRNINIDQEHMVIPSTLVVRASTGTTSTMP